MMKTAIYVRVSTDEQAKKGFSVQAQIDKLKNYIQIKDWGFYKVYADEGRSGKNIPDRPAINELIIDIKAGKVNNVLVYKIDRLTRSTRDLLELTELFNNNDCTFNSLMESIDTQTASGRMFLKIIGIFAEFERENIAERISLGCEKKVREGYSLANFTASYGYERDASDKIQKVNHEEAKIVREIYAMFTQGNISYSAIAKNLNHRGIKPKLGDTWGHASIRSILRNVTYIGKVRYGVDDKERYFEAEGKHEAIISEEVFSEAQSKMGKIKYKGYTKRPKDNNYFSGTLYCALCETKLVTHSEYKTSRKTGERIINGGYRCRNLANGTCECSRFSHRKIEKAFTDYMANIEDITAIDDTMLEEKSKQDSINALLREEYENAITKLSKREKDIMTLYINERISFDDYEQMIKIVTSEKQTYIVQLNNLPTQSNEDILLTKNEIITNIQKNWEALTNSERLHFVQENIKKIIAVSTKDSNHQVAIHDVKFYEN